MDRLCREYGRRRYVHPDPLELLYAYRSVEDREIAALLASSLAYGRVRQILRSAGFVLGLLGPSPRRLLDGAGCARLAGALRGFRHRFTTGAEVAALLAGIRGAVRKHGSLNECFLSVLPPGADTVLPALGGFAAALGCAGSSLLPSPALGSACKRLNLFLRWMVRRDEVDPGGWRGVSPRRLIVPLDAHMARIGRELGWTRRGSADMRMALDVTAALRRFDPDDPVKYDFPLTRLGIHPDLDLGAFLSQAALRFRLKRPGAAQERRASDCAAVSQAVAQ
jgi:uncharacterized protein (TIGR02757 family)